MNGLTVRFNLTNPAVQKYRSTVTDGAPWNVMRWINDGLNSPTRISAGCRSSTEPHSAAATGLPWHGMAGGQHQAAMDDALFLRSYAMRVNDGAVSYDGGYNFDIITTESDA